MRAFITGSNGQLGKALARNWPGGDVVLGDLPDFDITNAEQVREAIPAASVEIVLHCAAFTDVDACARDPQTAFRVNALGTQNVALACAAAGAPLALISTNEVFDGTRPVPYREFDALDPPNPYGQSKLAAEWYVQHLHNRFYIVRTAWMYSTEGRNFIHRVLQRAAAAQPLRMVTDELGSPTWAEDLAQALAALVETGRYGIYHLVNTGRASRYDFARRVLDLSGYADVPIEPIKFGDFERDSQPPLNGVLENTAAAALGIVMRPWEQALEEFLSQ